VRELTLLLPHAAPDTRLPALEKMLARGARQCGQPRDWRRRLLSGSGLAESEELPYGPICALGDGLAAEGGYWLCAEPVHLVADQARVYLARRASDLDLTTTEAEALAAEVNHLYREEGWRLWTPTPQRWYLRLPDALQLRTAAPDRVAGSDIHPWLPQGPDGLRLQAAVTEIGMLFHVSPVNSERSAAGRLPVNGLWLWGGGRLPAPPSLRWERLQGADPLLRGLATLTGRRFVAESADADEWLAEEGAGLVLFDEGDASLATQESRWFAPLLAALRRGRLDQLTIHSTATPCSWTLDRRAAHRWWRRRRPLWPVAEGAHA